jgi:hypothetical protein
MDRYVSPRLYTADLDRIEGQVTRAAYESRMASQLGFKEVWLQNAIARNPQLVMDACEEAELTDESWWFWAREFSTDAGIIDVLLVSETGRVAIVETKLSYNPEKRRSVLAQVLEYAVSLPQSSVEDLPELPEEPRSAGVTLERIEQRIHQGDFLLVIAGDQLDARAVRLGRSLLGDHLVNEWELALVEVGVFERMDDGPGPKHLIVPHLRGVIEHELRQIVKVEVAHGTKDRVKVERVPPEAFSGGRQVWTEERFFAGLAQAELGPAYEEFGNALRRLPAEFPDVELRWGTGKTGSLTVKRKNQGLLEFYLDGRLAFRRERPPMALGSAAGAAYLRGLAEIFATEIPVEIDPNAPTPVAAPVHAAKLTGLVNLLRKSLGAAD